MFRSVPFRFALPLNWKCIPFFKRWRMRHIHRHIHVLADSLAGNKWESERRRREKNQMSSIIISIFIRLHRKRGPFYSDGNSYNMVVCMHVKMYTTVNSIHWIQCAPHYLYGNIFSLLAQFIFMFFRLSPPYENMLVEDE